jgi:hypothetical protein
MLILKTTKLIKDLLWDYENKRTKRNEIDKIEEEENKKTKDKMF